jgi:hypothetical protein
MWPRAEVILYYVLRQKRGNRGICLGKKNQQQKLGISFFSFSFLNPA